MNNLQLTQLPVAKTAMLIRRPVAEVFDAFINPEITTKFWFTKSSGRLEVGKPVKWEWEMYNVSTSVTAKVIEPNSRLLIEWDGYSGRTLVEWTSRRILTIQRSSRSRSPAGRAMATSFSVTSPTRLRGSR